MKSKEIKQAKISISRITTQVKHECSCDCTLPSFCGEVDSMGCIAWPIAFEKFRMSYCPWCGLKLPYFLKGTGL